MDYLIHLNRQGREFVEIAGEGDSAGYVVTHLLSMLAEAELARQGVAS